MRTRSQCGDTAAFIPTATIRPSRCRAAARDRRARRRRAVASSTRSATAELVTCSKRLSRFRVN
jgi:hypothetical protein